ncbi:MAG: succinate dehydrogenase iron-sulfur subunit [Nitrososphaerales archaeon]
MEKEEKVRIKVLRFNPSKERKASYESYELPYIKGFTILDSLLYIKENLDHSLAIRYSCRMAICGSCGMLINGLPRLACYTQLSDVKRKEIVLEPLPNFPIIRDLVSDFEGFFEHHKSLKPYLIRKGEEDIDENKREYIQHIEDLEKYLQFSVCIKCGLCYASCPVASTDELFPGPQALSQAYRYIADNRDNGLEERLKLIDNPHGIWRCHFAGSCSKVCPKGVDPALGIQLLRRYLMSLRKPKKKLAEVYRRAY